jgi:hypothetical protein
MTAHKHLKQLVRERMKKTGESYTAARRHIVRDAPQIESDPAARWHFPGSIPATTALRVVLSHAGVRAPHTDQPFTEAMLFGLAGGIGIGVFSFFYEKEDIATFFVAGRHVWQDDLKYLQNACKRLGVTPVIQESSSARAGEKQLREMLDAHGPCIAWVDMAQLPHRAMPASYSGGGYHVITVYRIDDAQGCALIGDLTDQPIPIALKDLAVARGRIKNFKQRLLAVPQANQKAKDLGALVKSGLKVCHDELENPSMKASKRNFQLEAIRVWGERLSGSKDKERWERVFAPGRKFFRGLVSIYDYIEHYGTGGGLCRPIFAEFLVEATEATKDQSLRSLSEQYAELGRQWSALADSTLPDDVPLLREAKELCVHRAELLHSDAATALEEIRAAWEKLDALAGQAQAKFPLSDQACADLRVRLQERVMQIYDDEVAAFEAIAKVIAS